MVKDYLNEYRNEIRKRYEVEKNKINASFLVIPSAANLRNLCVSIFRDNKNIDDFTSFRLYFGFDYTIENVNNLNLQINLNKFVPIGRFLKGESELKSISGLDIAAMLVGFEDRPFNKFKGLFAGEVEVEKEEKDNLPNFESEKLKENYTKSEEEERFTTNPLMIITDTNEGGKIKVEDKKSWEDKLKYVAIGLLILVIGFFGINYFLNEKECMQWQKDHYELVDCDAVKGEDYDFGDVISVDQNQLTLKKIEVCDTTHFFIGGRPLVFYCKINGKPEYFNQIGFHPLSKQVLKSISPHIIEVYVKKCK